jgi:hypothetical protein
LARMSSPITPPPQQRRASEPAHSQLRAALIPPV